MKKPARKLTFVLAVLAAVLLFANSAFAAFTPPKKISSSTNDTILPQLLTDNLGYIHLVWMEADVNWSSPNAGIFYSRWNGDTWSTAEKISVNTTGFADSPALAVDSQRWVHAVYADDTGFPAGSTRIRYTRRESDGTWTTPATLPHPATLNWGWNPKIAVDTNDNLHVVYVVNDNSSFGGTFYYTSNDGTGWTTPTIVSYDTDGVTPLLNTQWADLFADKQGNVHAIFWDWNKGIFYRKLTGGTWGTPFNVTSAKDVEFTRLTVDDNGNPFIAWFQTRDRSVRVRGQVSGSWVAEDTLVTGAMRSFWGYPILGITTNSDGVIAVGWGEPSVGDSTIDIVYRSNDGTGWSPPTSVRTDTINSDTPWLFRDLWDNQHLIWTELNASNQWELFYSVVQGTQQTVGTTGGTVVANPGGTTLVTLNFKNGSLSADTEITVLIGPLPASVDPNVVTIPRAFTFGPDGTTFPANKEPTVTFNYTVAELAGGDPNTLQAYVWDSQTTTYSAKTGKVNTAQKTLKVTTIDHFSLFGVAARAVNTEFLGPPKPRAKVSSSVPLSIQFKLTYVDNGEPLSADEITLQIKDSEGNPVSPLYNLRKGKNPIVYNKGKNTYTVNIIPKDLVLGPGTYRAETYRSEVFVGNFEFEITE